MAQVDKLAPNITSFGLEDGKINTLHVAAGGALAFGILALDICDGTDITTYYYWPSTAGVLRYGSTKPTTATQDSEGAEVKA
jgi:hypothetical protein